jgi:hypothetical protein
MFRLQELIKKRKKLEASARFEKLYQTASFICTMFVAFSFKNANGTWLALHYCRR